MKKYSYERSKLNRNWKKTIGRIKKFHWRCRNLIFLVVSFIIAYSILKSEYIYAFTSKINSLDYIGSFIGGVFFTYGLTAVPCSCNLTCFE